MPPAFGGAFEASSATVIFSRVRRPTAVSWMRTLPQNVDLSARIENTTMFASSSSRRNSASPAREASSTFRAASVTFRLSTSHSVATLSLPRRQWVGGRESSRSAQQAQDRLRAQVRLRQHGRAGIRQDRVAHPLGHALREVQVTDARLRTGLVLGPDVVARDRA